ncbi:MAG: CBS domain-containing protein, partial [Halieaceae bacterium]|nr:CBS domain-containing protein [Halieaceae bacterium]
TIAQLMTTGGKTVKMDMLAAEALRIMEESKITSLVVVDTTGKVTGVIHLMRLLQAGIA